MLVDQVDTAVFASIYCLILLLINVGHEDLALIIEDDLGLMDVSRRDFLVPDRIGEEDCVRLASHWETARSPSRAVKYLIAAAERARARLARCKTNTLNNKRLFLFHNNVYTRRGVVAVGTCVCCCH